MNAGSRRVRSGIVLAVLVVVFVVGFWYQRRRSPFLRIARATDRVARVAEQSGLEPPTVMTLWWELGAGTGEAALARTARRFATLRSGLGVELAALDLAGHRELVEEAARQHGRDGAAAWDALRDRREAVAVVRFRSVRERFREYAPWP